MWGVRDETVRRKPWLIPVRDAVNFIIWLAGLFGDKVVWGGTQYSVQQGRMRRVVAEPKLNSKI